MHWSSEPDAASITKGGYVLVLKVALPSGAELKILPVSAGDTGEAGSVPGSGRSPEGGNDNPLQYSCWDNLMDRGLFATAWTEAHQASLSIGLYLDTTEHACMRAPVLDASSPSSETFSWMESE